MLNNKGQSLVMFVLIIPILLGLMALVIDVGNVIMMKNSLDNKVSLVMDYGLDEEVKSEDEIKTLLDYNVLDGDNEVKVVNGVVTITTSTYVDGIFSSIIGFNGFQVKSRYKGYLEGKKSVIKKEI